MHGVISDPEMQQRVKARMKAERITFEQLLEKHLIFPEEACDFIHKDYVKIGNTLAEAYDKPGIKPLMEFLWVLIIYCAKDNYNIGKVDFNIRGDINLGTFKKRK